MNTITKTHLALALALTIGLLALNGPSYAMPLQGDTDFSTVDAYVESQREALNIPGLAIAIVQGDQIAYLGSYGEAGKNRPVTPQIAFQIGSTTKSFTALAIMQLVEAGKVELDAPVQTYIPWFRVADEAASAQITVKHLLTQTSGFSETAGHLELAASDLSDQAIENSVRALKDVALERAPGEAYEYSNINFTVAGLVVQMVSGQSYESYIQEHIFDPLEMRHSFTSKEEAEQGGLSTGHVTFFGLPLAKDLPFNRGNISGGYLFCGAEDMAHYLIAQLNEGRYGDVSVISPPGMDAMHQPIVNLDMPGEFYGLGWIIGSVNGLPVIWHEGENGNYSTALIVSPQERLGIVVMSNINGGSVFKATSQIATGIHAILTGGQTKAYERPLAFFVFYGTTGVPALISLSWVGWMAFRFARRQKRPAARRGIGWWLWVIAAPIFVDLNLLYMSLVIIPSQWGMPLSGMAAWYPDCFLLLVGGAALVAGWGVTRTALTLRPARSQPNVEA